MSPVKEPNYFASEIRPENFSQEHQAKARRDLRALQQELRGPLLGKRSGGLVVDWDDYLRLFQDATTERAIGEASVCYLWSASALPNIAARIPDARIILILRNPAERAFSQYLHGLNAGTVHRAFGEQVQANLRAPGGKFDSTYPFLEFGLYFEQVKRCLSCLPADHVQIHLYQEFQAAPARILEDTFRFLNVDSGFVPDTSMRYLVSQAPGSVHAMDPRDRQFLLGYYREDVQKLASLLGRDLSAWLPGV